MPFYAGIGARATPNDILVMMADAGRQLCEIGLTLRSGAAAGADAAFERGCDITDPRNKEIFLPWKGFNDHPSQYFRPTQEALRLSENYHPGWTRLSDGSRLLMARNAHQLLGPTLNDPALFVACWTPEGKAGGGTGQAIRIAKDAGIPVFDLGAMSPDDFAGGIGEILSKL